MTIYVIYKKFYLTFIDCFVKSFLVEFRLLVVAILVNRITLIVDKLIWCNLCQRGIMGSGCFICSFVLPRFILQIYIRSIMLFTLLIFHWNHSGVDRLRIYTQILWLLNRFFQHLFMSLAVSNFLILLIIFDWWSFLWCLKDYQESLRPVFETCVWEMTEHWMEGTI